MQKLYKYIWRISGRQQVYLSLMAVGLFLIQLVPLELQRRIINFATDGAGFGVIGTLCLAYVAVAVLQGGLKLATNVFRGIVSEDAVRRLRLQVDAAQSSPGATAVGAEAKEGGAAISIIVSESEVVGGFVGSSFSEPILNAGILLSVLGYMLFTQPLLALVAIALFCPQFLFIPLLQKAINQRTQSRIETLRAMSSDIVEEDAPVEEDRKRTFRERTGELYRLNIEIFYRKFGMTFLMNLFHHLSTIGILALGSWLLLEGRTEVGTIVAFISGINRMNDPWGDLVNFFRNLTNTVVRYDLIVSTLGQSTGDPATNARDAASAAGVAPAGP